MLDLSRPLGAIEGLTLFADHEQSDLIYYLPDQIQLRSLDGGRPDLNLQIFFPEDAVMGGPAALEGAVGSILSLGVSCTVAPARLAVVHDALCKKLGREQLRLTPPPWEDGSVRLLLLDNDGSASPSPDASVRKVAGTRRPSLSDGQLTGLFHARLDYAGTALTAAALQGRAAATVGVLYDLSFSALRPNVKLRMSADLNRCAEYITAGVGVQAYYVSADVRTTFGRMRELGIIQVDQVTEADDPEAQRLVQEAVSDFYDKLMRELFSPTVAPAGALAGVGGLPASLPTSVVQLSFSYTRVDHARVIEVDYRNRGATRRSHNPASHLYDLSVASGQTSPIQRVPLSTAWRQLSVEVAAPEAFEEPSLRQLRVLLWRAREGALPAASARDGGLRMPATASPIVDLAFSRTDNAARNLQIIMEPDEPPQYIWQARLSYEAKDDVNSSPELWSEPHTSSSRDLDLLPSILAPKHGVNLRWGVLDSELVRGVDALVQAVAPDGTVLAARTLRVDASTPAASWALRRPENTLLTLQAALTYRLRDGTSLALPPHALLDRELIANDPFLARVSMAVVVAGAPTDLLEVMLTVLYRDPATGYERRQSWPLHPPELSLASIAIPVLHATDRVSWEATAVRSDGSVQIIGRGETTGGTQVLKFSDTRTVRVEWLGPVPSELALRWLRATFRARGRDGEISETKSLEWRGDAAGTQSVSLTSQATLEWQIEKRYEDGRRVSSPFVAVDSDLLAVSG